MINQKLRFISVLTLIMVWGVSTLFSKVVSISPPYLSQVPAPLEITVQFDAPVDPNNVVLGKSFLVLGAWAGSLKGTLVFSNGNQTVTFNSTTPVSVGEVISVNLANSLTGADGGKHFWEFRTAVNKVENFSLSNIQTIEVFQNPSEEGNLRTYGSFAGDLNQDGWHDVTVVNEDLSDLRVYMSDNSGGFVTPPAIYSVPNSFTSNPTPSTNEGGDFNLDGHLDIAVAQINGSAVSVFFGDGTGTLTLSNSYRVGGSSPTGRGTRGLCALDLNGDNYYDLVAANRVGNNISILINNGDGTFQAAVNMEGGVNAETACASGDFNEDGWEDIVVGGYGTASDGSDGQVVVLLSDGNGGLTVNTASRQSSNTPWMVITGDFNNDGHLDIVSDNNRTREFSYFEGDGTGLLSAGVAYPVARTSGGFLGPLAIDAGDMDGDGNLDVLTSNYGSADWTLYMGLGDGLFGNPVHLTTSIAGSDALLHDRDRDGDLDFTGIDEEADVIHIFDNVGDVVPVEKTLQGSKTIQPNLWINQKEQLMVWKGVAQATNIEIVDQKGKVLKTIQFHPNQEGFSTVDISKWNLPSGVHFYRAEWDNQLKQDKFVWLD